MQDFMLSVEAALMSKTTFVLEMLKIWKGDKSAGRRDNSYGMEQAQGAGIYLVKEEVLQWEQGNK